MRHWRAYDPVRDRTEAHRILRDQLRQGPAPHAIHPGEWDWWVYHPNPRLQVRRLITDGGLADVLPEHRELVTFGVGPADAIDLGRSQLGPTGWAVRDVSAQDADRIAALRDAGFEPEGVDWPVFARPTGGRTPDLPGNTTVRPVAGEEEHRVRAGMARRAFGSTIEPAAHDARYLQFMRSPAYVPDNDLIIEVDGQPAGFAVVWPDAELSLAQFEPVGTDPAFHRRGLGRALIGAALRRLHAAGIEQAHVTTDGDNAAAIGLYLACGFTVLDRIGRWALTAPSSG